MRAILNFEKNHPLAHKNPLLKDNWTVLLDSLIGQPYWTVHIIGQPYWTTFICTGTPPLTRFFGPWKNRVKGKRRYRRSILVLKPQNGEFELPKSTTSTDLICQAKEQSYP